MFLLIFLFFKLRSLINSMAQDPQIHAHQELVEDFKYNPGNAFAFVNVKLKI